MNEQEIMQAELDIAKFMGKKIVKDTDGVRYAFVAEHMGVSYPVNWSELKYRKDWNALMPVVEKIEATEIDFAGDKIKYFDFKIVGNYCSITGHTGVRQDALIYQKPYGLTFETKIAATYAAVLAFIKWYNEVKK